jgi:hypothetical protein
MRAFDGGRRAAVAIALTLGVIGGTPAVAQQAPAPAAAPTAEKADVKGFRSATWGMTDQQVREAIRKDFNIQPNRVTAEENPADGTTLIWTNVENLLPGTGTARVTYVLGHRSKRLATVTVTWGGAINPNLKAEAAVGIANLLRGHFAESGYVAEGQVQNAQLADGTVVVFRGNDEQNRMTLLVLQEIRRPEGQPAPQPPTAPFLVQLSYIQNPISPDVFRVPRGQF